MDGPAVANDPRVSHASAATIPTPTETASDPHVAPPSSPPPPEIADDHEPPTTPQAANGITTTPSDDATTSNPTTPQASSTAATASPSATSPSPPDNRPSTTNGKEKEHQPEQSQQPLTSEDPSSGSRGNGSAAAESTEAPTRATGGLLASPSGGARRSGGSSEDGPGSKIFIGGLSWETNEEGLRNYFQQFGKIYDCVIMRDRHTGHPRGFGFVTFADDRVAALVASSRHDLDGRQVEAKRAVPRSETPPTGSGRADGGGSRGLLGSYGGTATGYGTSGTSSQEPRQHPSTLRKIFVGGLPSSCGNEDFTEYFSKFGEIVDSQVMFDRETGNSRGFGFVTFAQESSVIEAVKTHRHELMGKMVEVKRAEPKSASTSTRSGGQQRNDAYGRGGQPGPGTSAAGAGQMSTSGVSAAAGAYGAYGYTPQQLMEQYGAYYSNPQWQQYYASLGYNYGQQYQQGAQGFNPYQYYAAHYAVQNAAAQAGGQAGAGVGGPGTGGTGVSPAGAGGAGAIPGSGAMQISPQGGDAVQEGPGGTGPDRYGRGGAEDDSGGTGAARRGASRGSDRYHPYR